MEKIVCGITALVYSCGVGTMLRNSISSHKNAKETKKEWHVVDSQSIEDIKPEDVPAPNLSLCLSTKKKDSKKE